MLDEAVSARAVAWHSGGVRWRIARGPATPKPAVTLSAERPPAMADLTLWISGEAELAWAADSGAEPVTEHYEISSGLGLNACLDDFESYLGLLRRLPYS